MDMQSHQVAGASLAFDMRGEGDPVLLIHGAVSQREIFEASYHELASTHRVLAYDRRGHGRSTCPTPDVRTHAADAATLIREVVGEPATVVGHSAGASTALVLGMERPELVQSLVLIEPAFHWFRPPSPDLLGVLAKVRFRYLLGREREAADAFAGWVSRLQTGGSAWDDAPPDLRELVLSNARGFRTESRPHPYGLTLDRVSTRSVADCAVPVTYLLGENSHPIFHRGHRLLVAALPDCRTVRVPDASHMLPHEEPSAVVDAVRAGTA